MLKILLAAASAVALSGCASTAAVFFHRPVVEDSVGQTLHTVSLSADRRSVIVMTTGPNKGKFCAEPPPDSAVALSTQLELMLKAERPGLRSTEA
jgi:hypothetical protein